MNVCDVDSKTIINTIYVQAHYSDYITVHGTVTPDVQQYVIILKYIFIVD